MPEPLELRLIRVLADAGPRRVPICHETDLVDDLGMDSMGFVDLAFELEETFTITIPEGDVTAAHFRTFGRLLAYLSHRVGVAPGDVESGRTTGQGPHR